MTLSRFTSTNHGSISLEQLDILADTGAVVSFGDYFFAAESLRLAHSDPNSFLFEPLADRNASRMMVHEIVHDAGETLVGMFSAINPGDLLPSTLEEIVCRFILQNDQITDLGNLRVFFKQKNLPDELYSEVPILAIKGSTKSAFHQHGISLLSPAKSGSSKITIRIIEACYGTPSTQHRFLEFYRAIENLFIIGIFNRLEERYFSDPKKALEQASIDLSKERNQLAIVIAKYNQSYLAADLANVVVTLSKSGNKFATALLEKFNKDKSSDPIDDAAGWKGVWLIYQVRCAIAHAGSDNLVFEFFDDSRDLLDEIIEITEKIMLGVLGYSFNN